MALQGWQADFLLHHQTPGSLAASQPEPWLTKAVLSSLPTTVCFLRAFYYLAPLVSDLVAFLSSCANSFSCTPLLPLR